MVLALAGYTAFGAFVEFRRTTQRLRKYVSSYLKRATFEWPNQTEEFALMDRVRSFEILLREVQAIQPRTPYAYRRVEEVRNAIEFLHRGIPIVEGRHLPLPRLTDFPVQEGSFSASVEADVRKYTLCELRQIKWLRLGPGEE